MSLLVLTDGKITDSLSTVPVTTSNNVYAERAFDTIYTNNTGKTLFVFVNTVHRAGSGSDYATIQKESPAGVATGIVGFGSGFINVGFYFDIVLVVKPGDTYRLTKAVGATATITFNSWFEIY